MSLRQSVVAALVLCAWLMRLPSFADLDALELPQLLGEPLVGVRAVAPLLVVRQAQHAVDAPFVVADASDVQKGLDAALPLEDLADERAADALADL